MLCRLTWTGFSHRIVAPNRLVAHKGRPWPASNFRVVFYPLLELPNSPYETQDERFRSEDRSGSVPSGSFGGRTSRWSELIAVSAQAPKYISTTHCTDIPRANIGKRLGHALPFEISDPTASVDFGGYCPTKEPRNASISTSVC